MATTTPNFGWPVPTSTDLVKDGATAIEALGDGIDTSLVDLKGGTTGQVLSKATSADMDFTWVTSDDANAIQNTIVDAKGDLIGASANDTPAITSVGTNGDVLVADSATATGLKWGNAISKGLVLSNTAVQAVSNVTDTTLSWDEEFWDTNGFHSTTVNPSRVTIPTGLGGKYLVNGCLTYSASAVGVRYVSVRVNGGSSFYFATGTNAGATFDAQASFSFVLQLTAGDYFEMSTFQNSGGSLNVTTLSRVYVSYLGA